MTFSPTGRLNELQIQIVAINSVLVFLSLLAVSLRFWARRIQRVSFYVDDYLILVALILALAINAILYYSVHVGVGIHAKDLPPKTIEAYALNLYILQLFWNTTLPIIKCSILLFLKRVFPVRSMKLACYGLIVFLVMWWIAFEFTAIFQCTPIEHDWLKKTTKGHCVNFIPFVVTLATTNLATDVALMILPVRQIWQLQMRKTQKIGLSITFAVGFVIVAVAIVRIDNVTKINIDDITYSDTYAHLWTAIESSLGVVVACIPHLMPVYRKVRGSLTTYGSGHKSYERQSSPRGSWNAAHGSGSGRGGAQDDSFGRSQVYSSTRCHSVSMEDKEKESEDGFDGLPSSAIGVTTHIERRVEAVDPEMGRNNEPPEAIAMQML